MTTATELAARYNHLSGKTVKASTYSKAKFQELIDTILQGLDETGLNGHCPHCGIDHTDNGWSTAEGIPSDAGGDPMTNEYICLSCGQEWGPLVVEPRDYSVFTLVDVARSLGINPKIARSRYRNIDNDGKMTRYQFSGSEEWARVAEWISPKRPAKA